LLFFAPKRFFSIILNFLLMSQHSRFVREIWCCVTTKEGKFSIIVTNSRRQRDDMTAANQSRPNEETALFLRAIDDVNVQLPF
jgi:hypothetical protein